MDDEIKSVLIQFAVFFLCVFVMFKYFIRLKAPAPAGPGKGAAVARQDGPAEMFPEELGRRDSADAGEAADEQLQQPRPGTDLELTDDEPLPAVRIKAPVTKASAAVGSSRSPYQCRGNDPENCFREGQDYVKYGRKDLALRAFKSGCDAGHQGCCQELVALE